MDSTPPRVDVNAPVLVRDGSTGGASTGVGTPAGMTPTGGGGGGSLPGAVMSISIKPPPAVAASTLTIIEPPKANGGGGAAPSVVVPERNSSSRSGDPSAAGGAVGGGGTPMTSSPHSAAVNQPHWARGDSRKRLSGSTLLHVTPNKTPLLTPAGASAGLVPELSSRGPPLQTPSGHMARHTPAVVKKVDGGDADSDDEPAPDGKSASVRLTAAMMNEQRQKHAAAAAATGTDNSAVPSLSPARAAAAAAGNNPIPAVSVAPRVRRQPSETVKRSTNGAAAAPAVTRAGAVELPPAPIKLNRSRSAHELAVCKDCVQLSRRVCCPCHTVWCTRSDGFQTRRAHHPKTRCDAVVKSILSHALWLVALTVCSLITLFAADALLIDHSSVPLLVWTILCSIALAVLTADIIMRSNVDETYFGSLLFVLDVAGTVSLVVPLSYTYDPIVIGWSLNEPALRILALARAARAAKFGTKLDLIEKWWAAATAALARCCCVCCGGKPAAATSGGAGGGDGDGDEADATRDAAAQRTVNRIGESRIPHFVSNQIIFGMLLFTLFITLLYSHQSEENVGSIRHAYGSTLELYAASLNSSVPASPAAIDALKLVFPECISMIVDHRTVWIDADRINDLRPYERVTLESSRAEMMVDTSSEWQRTGRYNLARTAVVIVLLALQSLLSTVRVRKLFLMPINRMLDFIEKHGSVRMAIHDSRTGPFSAGGGGGGGGTVAGTRLEKSVLTVPPRDYPASPAVVATNLPEPAPASAASGGVDIKTPFGDPLASTSTRVAAVSGAGASPGHPPEPVPTIASPPELGKSGSTVGEDGTSTPDLQPRDEIEMVEQVLFTMTRDNRDLQKKLELLNRNAAAGAGGTSGGAAAQPTATTPVSSYVGPRIVDLDAPITKVLASLNLFQTRLSASLSARDKAVLADVIEKLSAEDNLYAPRLSGVVDGGDAVPGQDGAGGSGSDAAPPGEYQQLNNWLLTELGDGGAAHSNVLARSIRGSRPVRPSLPDRKSSPVGMRRSLSVKRHGSNTTAAHMSIPPSANRDLQSTHSFNLAPGAATPTLASIGNGQLLSVTGAVPSRRATGEPGMPGLPPMNTRQSSEIATPLPAGPSDTSSPTGGAVPPPSLIGSSLISAGSGTIPSQSVAAILAASPTDSSSRTIQTGGGDGAGELKRSTTFSSNSQLAAGSGVGSSAGTAPTSPTNPPPITTVATTGAVAATTAGATVPAPTAVSAAVPIASSAQPRMSQHYQFPAGGITASGSGAVSPGRSDAAYIPPGILATLPKVPSAGIELNEIVSHIDEWNIDVFRLNELTSQQPLVYTSFVLFKKFGLFDRYPFSHYHIDNPYHNRTHAADVTLSTNYFLSKGGLYTHLTDMDVLVSLFAAMIHDTDHPGHGNSYEINSGSERAITYNDQSPLENHHLAVAFRLLRKPENNFLCDLPVTDFVTFRSGVVQLVLATDMKQHLAHVSTLRARTTHTKLATEKEQVVLLDVPITLKTIIKMSDIGHAAKARHLHLAWTERIGREFFAQGDMERKQGLTISPFCDRENADLPTNQIGFFEYVVLPLFNATLDAPFMRNCHVSVQQIVKLATDNLNYWKERKTAAVELKRKASAAASVASAGGGNSPRTNSGLRPDSKTGLIPPAPTGTATSGTGAGSKPGDVDVHALEKEVHDITKPRAAAGAAAAAASAPTTPRGAAAAAAAKNASTSRASGRPPLASSAAASSTAGLTLAEKKALRARRTQSMRPEGDQPIAAKLTPLQSFKIATLRAGFLSTLPTVSSPSSSAHGNTDGAGRLPQLSELDGVEVVPTAGTGGGGGDAKSDAAATGLASGSNEFVSVGIREPTAAAAATVTVDAPLRVVPEDSSGADEELGMRLLVPQRARGGRAHNPARTTL